MLWLLQACMPAAETASAVPAPVGTCDVGADVAAASVDPPFSLSWEGYTSISRIGLIDAYFFPMSSEDLRSRLCDDTLGADDVAGRLTVIPDTLQDTTITFDAALIGTNTSADIVLWNADQRATLAQGVVSLTGTTRVVPLSDILPDAAVDDTAGSP